MIGRTAYGVNSTRVRENLPDVPYSARRSLDGIDFGSNDMISRLALVSILISVGPLAQGEELVYKAKFLKELVERVPETLKNYDPQTGRFGSGIWICTDQNLMLPMAVAYATQGENNRYYKDAKLLDVIMKAGDALIDDMDANGQWVFRKKDGSTWGKISMPWTYSRWVRAYALIKNDMPPDRRERWAKALTTGYTHIAKTQFGRVHNIPAHHAMGLYAAGKALDRPEWCTRAARFMQNVVTAQFEGGYWSEDVGPVVNYNMVYVDALGTYYEMSADDRVLPAIEKAIRFHDKFTYPSGEAVETVDERNPFHAGIVQGNPAFTLTPEGRAWLRRQWRLNKEGPLSLDATALFLLHGQEGPVADSPAPADGDMFVMAERGVDRAAVLRKGPWFVCLSAYRAPVPKSRWHQDRQNLFSIWHERTGLIIGGGNTKLQPAWSNFTVGDMSLLRHTGQEQPGFLPKGELYHVPGEAALVEDAPPGLDLTYGPEKCAIRVDIKSERMLVCTLQATTNSGKPVLAHVTLLPRMKERLRTTAGQERLLTTEAFEWTAEQVGGGLTFDGFRLKLPESASLHWPALPHKPYRKDGRATAEEGRIEIRIPFDAQHPRQVVTVEILEP